MNKERVNTMFNRYKLFFFIFCISIAFICLTTKASVDQNYEIQRQELLIDINNVKVVSLNGDLDKLEQISNEMEKKWADKNSELYGYMMLNICGRFTSYNFEDKRQYDLAKRFAILALEKSNARSEENKIPIRSELRLVNGFILSAYDFKTESKKENWQEERMSLSKHFFRVYNRINKALDHSFDPNEPLPSWPRPSKFDGIWFDGMSPESITDTVVREKYQKELEEYWNKMDSHNNQKNLRKLEKDFIPKIHKNILSLYSGPNFNSKNLEIDSLNQDIAKYVKDEKMDLTLLEDLKNRLTKN